MGEREGGGIGKGLGARTRSRDWPKRNGVTCWCAAHEAIGTDLPKSS